MIANESSQTTQIAALQNLLVQKNRIVLSLQKKLALYEKTFGALPDNAEPKDSFTDNEWSADVHDMEDSENKSSVNDEAKQFQKNNTVDTKTSIQNDTQHSMQKIGNHVILDYVEDSPMFRKQLEGLEQSLSGLRTYFKEITLHTKSYIAVGKKFGEYGKQLADHLNNRKHSRALFTNTYKEMGDISSILSDFQDILSQIDHSRNSLLLSLETVLYKPLHNFADQQIKEASEMRKEVLRLSDEYDSLLSKALFRSRSNSSASSNSGTSENIEEEVVRVRRMFELARYDLVRYLNRLDAAKKFVLVEACISALYAYKSHFNACHQFVKSVEASLVERSNSLSRAQEEFAAENKLWSSQRLQLEYALQVQSTSKVSLGQTIEVEILSIDSSISKKSNNSMVKKQGYLFVRNALFPGRSWKRQWFQIHSGKLFQFRKKEMDSVLICDLMLSRIRDCSTPQLPYSFEIIDNTQSKHVFQAISQLEMTDWIEATRKSTACMLEQQESPSRKMDVSKLEEYQKLIAKLQEKNNSCMDCGTCPAMWVSINIGGFLCIECSGIHRSIGVHVSKVRSITLDTLDNGVLEMLLSLGNKVVNEIWEPKIAPGWTKPTEETSRELKEKWITAKYKFLGFTEHIPEEEVKAQLYEASIEGNLKRIAWCVGHGVDLNAIVDNNGSTSLHICAGKGYALCCEFLVLNGASLVVKDKNGQLPYDSAKAGGFEEVKLNLMQKMTLEQYQH